MTERLHFHFSLSRIGEGNGNPLQCSCLENPRDGGAWWSALYGVAQSQTRLKQLSSSSTDAALTLLAEFLTVSSDILFQVEVDLRQIHSYSRSNHQEHSLYPALKRETTHTVHSSQHMTKFFIFSCGMYYL